MQSPLPARQPAPPSPDVTSLEPVPTLLRRVRAELAAQFNARRPLRVSRAPGQLNVMGGIADYTGSLVCEMPLHQATAVAIQERDDRELQIFSFNLLDLREPFTLRMPLDALVKNDSDTLRREFAEPGRSFGGYPAGCLRILHERKYVDLGDPAVKGLDIVLLSTVPPGAGVGSSAAIAVATMLNLADHFGLRETVVPNIKSRSADPLDPLTLAAMCQEVENRIIGVPCGVFGHVASCAGRAGSLLKILSQPHELQGTLAIPEGIRVVGIDSAAKQGAGRGMKDRTRCAAFMGHRMILAKMEELGQASGMRLASDPMRGYLANLPLRDYKGFFRSHLPRTMTGREFLERFGPTINAATQVEPDTAYHVRGATDHHTHEADRVRKFVKYLEEAGSLPRGAGRSLALDKAGHLMYGSHGSYQRDALLGTVECDLLVDLIRKHEREGFYGAKITGGSGGTVAVLCNANERSDLGLAMVMRLYEQQTGNKPELLAGSSEGAWAVGTEVVSLGSSG